MVVDEPTAVGRPVVEGNAGLVFERLARSLAGLDGEGSGGRIHPAPRNVGDRLSVGGDTGIAVPVVIERESIFDTTHAVHHPEALLHGTTILLARSDDSPPVGRHVEGAPHRRRGKGRALSGARVPGEVLRHGLGERQDARGRHRPGTRGNRGTRHEQPGLADDRVRARVQAHLVDRRPALGKQGRVIDHHGRIPRRAVDAAVRSAVGRGLEESDRLRGAGVVDRQELVRVREEPRHISARPSGGAQDTGAGPWRSCIHHEEASGAVGDDHLIGPRPRHAHGERERFHASQRRDRPVGKSIDEQLTS